MKNIFKTGSFLALIFLLALSTACTQQSDGILSVGSNFAESNTRVVMVDTFSMQLSTILIDSMATSSSVTALVGQYIENETGSLIANSFFQIGIPSSSSTSTDDIVDSIALVLDYSTYSYGDTSQQFSIAVHRVTEDIETFDDGNLYNNSNFGYHGTPIGIKTFYPRPNSGNEVTIRLDDNLAVDLFEKLLNSDQAVSSDSYFTNYFKGLCLISNNTASQCILGFSLADSTIKMRIYGHRINEELEEWEIDFPVINNSSRFNRIRGDRSSTLFESLVEQKTGLISGQTNDISYVIGGVGIMTGIKFPYLEKLLEINHGEFFKAELVLHPIIDDSNSNTLPSGLFLYQAGKYNKINSIYADTEGSTYYATIETDKLYNESTLTFDVTKFLKYELYDSYYDEEQSFILAYDNPTFNASCNQIAIGGFENEIYKPSLKIYYIYYE